MCRWLTYIGAETTPHKFLYEEELSLIEQSHHARKSKTSVNGDGFGLGWYNAQQEVGRFRDILPAWSDENLLSLSKCIRSGLFMAHVRAATDTTISRTNCHPFVCGQHVFMHNGQIGGYRALRRDIEALIPNTLYHHRLGSTDSEALFLYLLSLLETHAFHEAVQVLTDTVEALIKRSGRSEPFRFTSAYSDGKQICVVRYASDDKAPSLCTTHTAEGWIIVSEPLDSDRTRWQMVPKNHTLILKSAVSEPIITAL